jgi:hypothetical protein
MYLPLNFADKNNALNAAGIKSGKSADSYLNKLNFRSHLYRIYNNIVPYLEISTVSMNSTISDLSFVTVKTPIPMSATPLYTSDTIPFHEPLADIVTYESVTKITVLLAGVRN